MQKFISNRFTRSFRNAGSKQIENLTSQNLKDYRYLFLVEPHKRDDILLLQQIGKKVIIVAPQSELRQNDNIYNAADATISSPSPRARHVTDQWPRTRTQLADGSKGKTTGAILLLAEDNLVNHQVLQNIFARWCPSSNRDDGKQAIEALLADPEQFDVVLMDMQMPVVDGLEATKIIRQTPNIQHIPIIALTANAEQADVDACIAAGMDDHSGIPMIP